MLPLPCPSLFRRVGDAGAPPAPVTLPMKPPRFSPFTPSTSLVPTASTAPLGADKLGPSRFPSVLTWKSFTCVPFQTPIGPMPLLALPVTVFEIVDAVVDGAGAMCISAVKISDHKTEVYQPSDSVDHSNRCTLIVEGEDRMVEICGWSADSGREATNSRRRALV